MLKKIYTKKLIICFSVLFAILLIYVIPSNEDDKLEIKEELEYVNVEDNFATIYLYDKDNLLASSKMLVKNNDKEKLVKELIEGLIIDGTKSDNIPNGFKAVLPQDTKINSISFDNDLIKIDFNKELLNTNKDNEEKIIESIVYTLTSIDDINKVIIYIDGEILTKLPQSKITLPSTLDRSFGINKEYNITNKDNINKTTIYYISEFNDKEYYVPVTKINNDSRDKIEIIVDELSSSNTYKTNLMSYLNNNTEILSVNQNDNELSVNFNDAIFNDINTKEILEEVIYTISMSISDNYNVNTVVFNVNDEEIYKSVIKTIE